MNERRDAENAAPREKVFLYEQEEYDVAAIREKVVRMATDAGLDVAGRTVLLKPSFVYPGRGDHLRGITTQVEFIGGAARGLKDLGAAKVMVAENSVVGVARVAFNATGVKSFIEGCAVPVYLDEQKYVKHRVENALVQGTFIVPKIWLAADVFISLPKIKTNLFTDVSLSVKNSMGFLGQLQKAECHDWRLHRKLVDLFRVRPPDFVMADSIYAGQGQGPMCAEPFPLGVMIGGKNALAVDSVSCHMMGYDPSEVEHIRLLGEAGMGPIDLNRIEINDSELLKRARRFERPDWRIKDVSPRIHVYQGAEFYCPGGCAGLVRGILDPWLIHYGPENVQEMNIILGKPIVEMVPRLDPKRTLVLGDCAAPYRDKGMFIPGCPPLPINSGLNIVRMQGFLDPPLNFLVLARSYMGFTRWAARELVAERKSPFREENPIMFPYLALTYMKYYTFKFLKLFAFWK
ncbi:MAG: DUF362 domain-containing protein [bacterium]